ncbi:hypothetical protein GCM10009616_31390 [Microlunatus lacustris]
MNRIKTTVGAVAALLVLASCGAADDPTEPVPDDPATSAATSAPPSSLPSTSPTVEGSGPTAASPSGVLSLVESCRAVVDDQQDSVETLRGYARNPLSADVDVQDLDRLRSELLAAELSAPEPLRQELNTQVGVLNGLVQGIQDGKVQNVDMSAFQEARDRITTLCEEAGR